MYEVFVTTFWNSESGSNEMDVDVRHPMNWTDVTGQVNVVPEPNVVVARGLIDAALLAVLQSEAAMPEPPHLILSYEEVASETI